MTTIEKHPDFSLTPNALELIDPEIRESENLNRFHVRELEKKTDQPIRDFAWETSGKKTPISQMDPEFLLVVARHCVHRADLYHEKVQFFMDVLTIVEEHARKHGLQIPETVEEIQQMIDTIQARQEHEYLHGKPTSPARSFDGEDILLDGCDKSFIERLRASVRKPKSD